MVSVAASTATSSAFVIDKRWLILLLRKTNVSSSSSICILSLVAMISTIVLLSYQPISTPITIFDVDNAAKNFTTTTTTTTTAKLSSHAHDNLDHHHHPYAQNQKEQYNRHSSSDHDYNYDWNLSTEENYSRSSISGNVNDNANDGNGHYFQYDYLYHGDFRTNRKRLDRSYHTNYIRERQILQDTIIKSFLIDVKQQQQYNDGQGDMLVQQQQQQQQLSATIISRSEREECTNIIPDMSSSSSSSLIFDNKYNHQQQHTHTHQHQHTQSQSSPSPSPSPPPPWIIFTAGVYGAGKSHTIKRLQRNGCFPSNKSFVTVDPDEIRQLLPEFSTYIEKTPLLAGEYTQKESGMIAELLTDTALSNNFNVLVDGSLKDSFWYEEYFIILRRLYPKIQIGIIYVTAPLDEIYDRVKKRSVITGRSIPMGTLQQSIEDVPKSVKKLQSSVDFFFEIHNDSQQQKQQ